MEREMGKMDKALMAGAMRAGLAAGFAVLALGIAAPVTASAQQDGGQTASGLKLSNSKAPVKIEADKFEMRDKEGIALFTGNVAVAQGDALLKAGKMTVYLDKSKNAAAKGGDQADAQKEPANAGIGGFDSSSIDHIDIAGKVYLKSGTQVATGETGKYDAKNQIMILEGQKVVLTDGDNVLTGCKLTAHLDTGRANVESCKGASKGRVSIIMAPKDQQQGGGAPKQN